MAINRYDSPAQAQFINTYVPIPFEELMQAGLAKQQQYNTGLSGFEQARSDAEQLKYISGSEDEKYIRNVVLPTFEGLADEYSMQDFSDPNVVRSINNKIRSNIDRERVRRIQESYNQYGEYQKDLRKLGLEGKSAPYLNRFDPSTFSSEFGIFNELPEAAVNYQTEAQGYFNNLKDSLLTMGPNGEILSGVDNRKIHDVSMANLSEFMGSTAGRQAIADFKYRGDTRPDEQIAYDVLQSAGQEFIRKNLGYAPQYAYEAGKPESSPLKDVSNTQSINNPFLSPSDDLQKEIGVDPRKVKGVEDINKAYTFDKEGNLVRKTASKDEFEKAFTMKSYNKWAEGKQKEYEEEYNKSKSIIDNIRKFNPKGFGSLSDSEALYAYTQAYNNSANIDFNKYLYETDKVSTSKRDAITRLVIPNIGGRNIINAETGKESGKPVNTLTDLYDMFDVPKEDRQTENIKITGIVPALGGYSASIEVAGQPRDFIISPNQREQSITSLVKAATEKNLNGKLGEKTVTVGGRKYIVTTRLANDEGVYNFESNIRSADGKEIINGKSSMALNELEGYTASLLSQVK